MDMVVGLLVVTAMVVATGVAVNWKVDIGIAGVVTIQMPVKLAG